jgi:hypothetical protein
MALARIDSSARVSMRVKVTPTVLQPCALCLRTQSFAAIWSRKRRLDMSSKVIRVDWAFLLLDEVRRICIHAVDCSDGVGLCVSFP